MNESFGPEYVRPPQADCPDCDCCSAALCAKGRSSLMQCLGHVATDLRGTVANCACSAETTKHTASWRAAHIRATRLATEMPLAPEAEAVLRDLASGTVGANFSSMETPLRMRGLLRFVQGKPVLTAFGAAYLAARDGDRTRVLVKVVDVDTVNRIAQVEVTGWPVDEPVPVLLDLLRSDTGMNAEQLSGRCLEADANVDAPDVDRQVLTRFRVPAAVPGGTA
ncbi:hypothetical protein OG216_19670 [Streptomycetaceae bacterium NBC_01309]